MNNASYIITDDSLTAIINDNQYTVTRDNPSYGIVRQGIIDRIPVNELELLFQSALAVKKFFTSPDGTNRVVVKDGELFFRGEPINNVVVDRILLFMSEGLPVEPLVNFLERLLANPSKRAIEELYKFLEHKHLPISAEGFLLGYKGVNEDYTDCHTGTFTNVPGTVNSMERNLVDDDARQACSNGFHVGSLEYATGFGQRTVIVQVDPADVVSIPFDSDCQKMRTCKYEVLADFQGSLGGTLRNASDPYNTATSIYDANGYDSNGDYLG